MEIPSTSRTFHQAFEGMEASCTQPFQYLSIPVMTVMSWQVLLCAESCVQGLFNVPEPGSPEVKSTAFVQRSSRSSFMSCNQFSSTFKACTAHIGARSDWAIDIAWIIMGAFTNQSSDAECEVNRVQDVLPV